MSVWTKATLGVAAVAVCAGGASAQVGCTTCGPTGGAGGVFNTIPKCNRHSGLTQYPLSEKRYIKQFCQPTIAPGSCFGHFKTRWSAWSDACPQWGHDDQIPTPLAQGYPQPAPPAATPAPGGGNGIYQPKPAETAPAPAPADPNRDGPPSRPPVKTAAPKSLPDLPQVPPMPPTAPTPGGVKLPVVPPAGGSNF